MRVFYIRCSTEEQNEARQVKQAEETKAEKIFIDKLSGKNTDRKELKELLNYVREGDIVYCSDISRIARNTKDLLNIVEELNRKGVDFISLKESIDTTTPQGKFILTIFGAMAELERESIAIAKEQGKYKGKQKTKIDETKMREVCQRWRDGKITAVSAMAEMGLKPNTFYRRVKEMGL